MFPAFYRRAVALSRNKWFYTILPAVEETSNFVLAAQPLHINGSVLAGIAFRASCR